MNILLVSQCNKQALTETRRILDQFAERKGDGTWLTAITQEGLLTLRKLLRQTARRNTAVACHWIKSAGQTELLWIVGNRNRFNESGSVPTNRTGRDILKSQDENQWHTAEIIALLAGLAGLFHDMGKANRLFQNKLRSKGMLRSEPYRHEWLSLRLFQAFVGSLEDDRPWLEKLSQIAPEDDARLLASLVHYQDSVDLSINPFQNLPPLAKVVGWLIVSHHRLLQFDTHREHDSRVEPLICDIDRWLTGKNLSAFWNSPQCQQLKWTAVDRRDVWSFPQGTPMASQTWCERANKLALRALNHNDLFSCDWMEDSFTLHMARLSLMLSDHSYSGDPATEKWQDPTYQAYANTDRLSKRLKQRLDEHCIGVSRNAFWLAKRLPLLRRDLPAITRHKAFKQRSSKADFVWQNRAFDVAKSMAMASERQGFFGVNMASTGCGKTFANARIMYALADEKLGCRFSIALGLRTLTLQTGDALQARLGLESDDLAVLIGSQAVQQLHELAKESDEKASAGLGGSESAESLFSEHQYIRYEGALNDGLLKRWCDRSDSKLNQLLSAPVLVSTIDHLMPATESARGGRQIAPMLRLLTSDLVLDEPDDFDLADLPGLCRLVNWAGMLGSRVLLSSATLPPALVCALFDAYRSGRRLFNQACVDPATPETICCGWFDEFGAEPAMVSDPSGFRQAHKAFVSRRIDLLGDNQLRHAELLPISTADGSIDAVTDSIAHSLAAGIWRLHQAHHQQHPNNEKTVSIGLIRMANINAQVAVARKLFSQPPAENCRIHFCIYHSQHPLLVRSKMEQRLDSALDRHDPETLWQVAEIETALKKHPEKHHIFVVCATSVAEVGRDHDYDWAIVEPSSMRSLIQLAGRIQRHRKNQPSSANLLILSKNLRALRGDKLAYYRPGFESDRLRLELHDLQDVLIHEQYTYLSAKPRIQTRSKLNPKENLVDLEHVQLQHRLFGSKQPGYEVTEFAALWWPEKNSPNWSFELQRRMPFRQSRSDELFILYQQEQGEQPLFHQITDMGEIVKIDQYRFEPEKFTPADGVQPWLENDVVTLLDELVDKLERESDWVSRRFTELRLRTYDSENKAPEKWRYHPWLGVYGTLK